MLKLITAKDIPGRNNFAALCPEEEEIFCSGDVNYAGQSVGLIVAGFLNFINCKFCVVVLLMRSTRRVP